MINQKLQQQKTRVIGIEQRKLRRRRRKSIIYYHYLK